MKFLSCAVLALFLGGCASNPPRGKCNVELLPAYSGSRFPQMIVYVSRDDKRLYFTEQSCEGAE